MGRLLILIVFVASFSLVGYAAITPALADEGVTKKESVRPIIKCSTCGVEFTSSAGVEDHVRSFPGHHIGTLEERVSELEMKLSQMSSQASLSADDRAMLQAARDAAAQARENADKAAAASLNAEKYAKDADRNAMKSAKLFELEQKK